MFGLFSKKNKESGNEILIKAPVAGTIKSLSEVKDQVFSKRMIGDGIAIVPSGTDVVSPAKGLLKVAFPTGHAYGVQISEGPEILIHIGLDTVELNGEGFTTKVKQGSKVELGAQLCKVDLEKIKAKGKETDVIVVITSETLGSYKIKDLATGQVKLGDVLFKLVK